LADILIQNAIVTGQTMDTLTKAQRSRHMARVRTSGTAAELAVRSIAHRMGFRFRINRRDLPGRPDIVFPARHAVVFVHGCFWHKHEGCRRSSTPSTNIEFWTRKFEANRARDEAAVKSLSSIGWRSLVVWECETKNKELIAKRLVEFLGPPTGSVDRPIRR